MNSIQFVHQVIEQCQLKYQLKTQFISFRTDDRKKEKELSYHHLFGLFFLTKCRQKSIEGAFGTTSGANTPLNERMI
jgi:hypothetical protein